MADEQCVVLKVPRKSVLRDAKKDLIFCLSSVSSSLTLSVLENLFREETENELSSVASALGHSSVGVMLDSDEFADTIKHYFDNTLMERVYTLAEENTTETNANVPIATSSNGPASIVSNVSSADAESQRRAESIRGAIYDNKIIQGKERLLRIIAKAGGERNKVVLIDIQRHYQAEYKVLLEKSELRRFFPTGHIKQVFDNYMKDELDVTTDPYRSGSFFVSMKMPFSEIMQNLKGAVQERSNLGLSESYSSEKNEYEENNSDGVEFAKLSKFALNSHVDRAYNLFDLNGLNRKSMAPHAKPKTTQNSATADTKSTSGTENIANLMDLIIPDPYSGKLPTDENAKTNGFSESAVGGDPQDGGRLVGNFEELNLLFSTDARSQKFSNRRFNNNSIGNNNNKNKNNVSGNVASDNKFSAKNRENEKTQPEVKYTKRCEGTFTDDEMSSEDELDEGNRVMMQEAAQNCSPSKSFDEKENRVETKSPDLQQQPDLISLGGKPKEPRGCHAEKFLQMALARQEENVARRLAHRIAHFQKSNPNALIEKIFAKEESENCKKEKAPQEVPVQVNHVIGRTSVKSNGHNAKNGGNSLGDYIDEDFRTNLPNRVHRPSANKSPSSGLSPDIVKSVSLLMSNGTDKDAKDDLSPELYTLAATVSLIVMNRKPSITLIDLENALFAIYAKKFVPGVDFAEESWKDFIDKYCKNVFAMKIPSDVLYVWKVQGDADFKSMMARVGKVCAEKAPAF